MHQTGLSGPLVATAWTILFLFALLRASPDRLFADHPAFEMTISLGPGNEDVESRVNGPNPPWSEYHRVLEKLAGLDLSGRDLRQAEIHLYDNILKHVRFVAADLTAANLVETVFDGCDFSNARLRRVKISHGFVRPNCSFSNSDISMSQIWLSREQLESTANYKKRQLADMKLSGRLAGTSFAEFDLSGTLLESVLTGCDFRGRRCKCAAAFHF